MLEVPRICSRGQRRRMTSWNAVKPHAVLAESTMLDLSPDDKPQVIEWRHQKSPGATKSTADAKPKSVCAQAYSRIGWGSC
uniref:Uncharacterized protein n=1 Tax=Peronospora matthiolae TaxID=2874970 RepID=A0AAV1TXV3_9STRA